MTDLAERSVDDLSESELRRLVSELRRSAPARAGHDFTYRRDAVDDRGIQYSYFQDLFRRNSDPAARSRLERHALESDNWRRQEFRINPNTTTGTGGYFTPPKWLIEDAATFPRPKRVLANLVNHFDLPPGCASVNIPVMTTGNAGQQQAPDEQAPSGDVTDASTSSNAVTIAGIGDVALQVLEMSPQGSGADHAWFKDLTEAYDLSLEQQLIFGQGGTGPQAQFLGLLNVPSRFTAYTDGSPTGKAMYPFFGQVAAHIGNQRGMPPYAWLMRTARFGWLSTSEDGSTRPLEFPELMGEDNALCPGAISGWPVWMADAIPQNLTWVSTTVASGSNNVNLGTFLSGSTGTLNVASTGGFNTQGSLSVANSAGVVATVTYTGTSGGNAFTGCVTTAGSGSVVTGGVVSQLQYGTTTNQDTVIACIPSDIYLFEGNAVSSIALEVLSGTLEARFIYRNYAAAITGRYAAGVSSLGGTGLVVQSGFTT